jgi:hypothetical protein
MSTTTTKEEALKKIEAAATTPLKPDTSEDMIYVWHDPKTELPAKDQDVILYLTEGALTIGHWIAHRELWQTDLGPFPLQSVANWCNLPKVPKGI